MTYKELREAIRKCIPVDWRFANEQVKVANRIMELPEIKLLLEQSSLWEQYCEQQKNSSSFHNH